LADLNISVVPNARVENDVEASIDPCDVPLSTGVTLKADVFVKCFPTWNTGWVPDGFVDSSGRIKVNEFHQSLADDRVFAIGCCTHTQYSVIPMLDVEIASAAKNLAALLRGETPLPSVFKQTAPVKNPAAIQLPFGDWAMINVASFDSGLMKCMAYCCGCLNPLWPCCGCCGWPCMYPEGGMAGKCIKMVAPHGKVRVKENGHHNRIRFTSFGPAISSPADFHRSGAFSPLGVIAHAQPFSYPTAITARRGTPPSSATRQTRGRSPRTSRCRSHPPLACLSRGRLSRRSLSLASAHLLFSTLGSPALRKHATPRSTLPVRHIGVYLLG